MLVETFTSRQFMRLKPYVLDKGIQSIESDLYVLSSKLNQPKQLLKKYKKPDGEYFGNKLLTINSLITNKDRIGIEELVFPERLAAINKKIVAFIMMLIENNTNLSVLLQDKKNSVKEKIKWLKQVGCIVSKVQHVHSLEEPFLLGDIHESNFILDHNSNKILCVDLDGCKISNNKIYSMKYGSFNEKFFGLPHKYPLDKEDNPIPNFNTEWYCYTIMILNMIGNGPVHKLLIQHFYDYIQYLRDNGFSRELVSCFVNIYTNHDNYSPCELLNQIPDDLNSVSYDSFVEKAKLEQIYR